MNKSVASIRNKNKNRIQDNAYEILKEWDEDMSTLSDRDKHIIDAFIISTKNRKIRNELVRPKNKNDDSYYVKYKKEKRERKRYQNMVGQIDARIDKVNAENEQIFTDMQISIDYWRFSFHLATKSGVDFLNYEIGLLEKGLIKKEEEVKIKDE